MILLRLRGSALLRQGLLSEPEASSDPVSMFLACPYRCHIPGVRFIPSTTLPSTTQRKRRPPQKTRQPSFPHTSYIGNRNTEKNLFVNSVNRITIQKSLDIINRNIHDPLSGSLRSPGDMRSDDAVFSLEKRIIPP